MRYFMLVAVGVVVSGCTYESTLSCTTDHDCDKEVAGSRCDATAHLCRGPEAVDASAGSGGNASGGSGGTGAAGSGGGAGGASDAGSTDALGSCGRNEDCAAATPVCAGNRCVECASDDQCSSNPAKSFCRNNVCVGCAVAGGSQACAGRNATAPVCVANSGTCVECVAADSSDCKDPAKPICNTTKNRCEKCTTDTQCSSKAGSQSPGLCLDHQGGRCATDAETLYVQKTSTCSDGGALGGTACTGASPCCGLQAAVSNMSGARTVIAVSGPTAVPGFDQPPLGAPTAPITIIGRGSKPPITAPGVQLEGGTLFLRNLEIAAGAAVGITAANASVTARDLLVDANNKGGVLLDRCTFDLQNVTVTKNGPGTAGAITWGGILVQNASQSPRKLTNVSVTKNEGPGISCSASVDGSGVYATNNSAVDVSPTCDITACAAPMPGTCGAE